MSKISLDKNDKILIAFYSIVSSLIVFALIVTAVNTNEFITKCEAKGGYVVTERGAAKFCMKKHFILDIE